MTFDELWKKARNIPSEFWWRSLSFFLSAFILVPNITLLMFLIYMAEFDFFSYDFFIEGVFGMKLFFITTVMFLVIGSFVFYGPLFIFFAKRRNHKVDGHIIFIFGFVSAFSWLLMIVDSVSSGDYQRMLFISLLCLLIAGHLITLIFYESKKQFISLATVSSTVVFLSINFSPQAAQVVSIGLKAFGSGGDLPISITNAQSGNETKGKLKLITPKNIYFTPDSGSGVATYPLMNISYYVVDGNEG